MDLHALSGRAAEVRAQFAALEKKKYGKEWDTLALAAGFVGDVGDLTKLIMARQGLRDIPDLPTRLDHEFADCLWSLLVLARDCGVDLESAFGRTMQELEQRIQAELAKS